MSKNKGGRPCTVTPSKVAKLEEAFMLGCTDLEACFAADISKDALYRYCDKHPEFRERKEALKSRPVYLARRVVIDALQDNDILTAHKVIERKDGTKNVVAGDPDAPLQVQEITRTIIDPK